MIISNVIMSEPLPSKSAIAKLVIEISQDITGLSPAIQTLDNGICSWILYASTNPEPPKQGWKIHVSATVHNMEYVLKTALPVLFRFKSSFKVLSTKTDLMHFNQGKAGISQVGKFITVYPENTESARQLCHELHNVLNIYCSPRVPSDKQYKEGSLVYYRYGGHETQWSLATDGLWIPAITLSDGRVTEDPRNSDYIRPEGIEPLFPDEDFCKEGVLSANGYTAYIQIAQSHKSAILIVYKGKANEFSAVKQAFGSCYPYGDSTSATDLLRHEHCILKMISAIPGIPRIIDYFHDEYTKDEFMIQEYLSGVPLSDYIKTVQGLHGRHLNLDEIIRIALGISKILSSLHKLSIVHRDIKPANILIDPDTLNNIWLIDFECSAQVGQIYPVGTTRGYRLPSTCVHDPSSYEEDIYAFGALLAYLLTGYDFSYAPDEAISLSLYLDASILPVPAELRDIVDRCIARACDCPSSSLREITIELEQIQLNLSPNICEPEPKASSFSGNGIRSHTKRIYFDLASRLETTIRGQATFHKDGKRLWQSTHPYAFNRYYPFLNIGSSGILLYLCRRYRLSKSDNLAEEIKQTALSLMTWDNQQEAVRPGFYMGFHGISLSVAAAGTVLGDVGLIDWSFAKLNSSKGLVNVKADVFSGSAGIAIAGILFETLTGKRLDEAYYHSFYEHSRLFAENKGKYVSKLLESYHGFAHGLAGFGYACSIVSSCRGNEWLVNLAREIGMYLLDLTLTIPNEAGMNVWSSSNDAVSILHGWCHGTVGFGWFFLELYLLTKEEFFLEGALGAGNALSRYAGSLDSTRCHGLSGAVGYMLDLYCYTGDESWSKKADHLAENLILRSTVRNGFLVWISEAPEIVSSDFMVGMSGVGEVIERLKERRIPDLLTRAGMHFMGKNELPQVATCTLSDE
jgi:serine/threonine protein kinase